MARLGAWCMCLLQQAIAAAHLQRFFGLNENEFHRADFSLQGAAEARNANYAQIAAQLAFKRGGAIDEDDHNAGGGSAREMKRAGSAGRIEVAEGDRQDMPLADEPEVQVRLINVNTLPFKSFCLLCIEVAGAKRQDMQLADEPEVQV